MGVQLLPVIGHLRCTRVSHMHLNGFFFCCFPPTFKMIENTLDVLSTKIVHIDFLISNCVINAIN